MYYVVSVVNLILTANLDLREQCVKCLTWNSLFSVSMENDGFELKPGIMLNRWNFSCLPICTNCRFCTSIHGSAYSLQQYSFQFKWWTWCNILIEICGFSYSPQENATTVPQIRSSLLLWTSCPVQYSLIILAFNMI